MSIASSTANVAQNGGGGQQYQIAHGQNGQNDPQNGQKAIIAITKDTGAGGIKYQSEQDVVSICE